MKKRPTPYALIGAVALGFIAIVAFYAFTQQEATDRQQALDDLKKQLHDQYQSQIDTLAARQKTETDIHVAPSTSTRRVLYAKVDIDAGVQITPDMFQPKDTPVDLLAGAYTVNDAMAVEKDFALRPIRRDDALTDSNVGPEAPRLSDRIKVGMKAMTIPVIGASGNLTGGFLVDGDTIDLMFNHLQNPADQKSPTENDVVMQNVSVLFVPGSQQRSAQTDGLLPAGQGQGVTLEVTLQEAQILTLLQAVPNGSFGMVLRAHHDANVAKTQAIAADDLMDNLKGIQSKIDRANQAAVAMQNEQKMQEEKDKTHETQPTTAPAP